MQPLAFLLFLTLPYGGAHAQGSTACSLTSASYGTLAFNCAGTQLTQQFPSVVTATPPQPPQSGVYYIAPNGDDKKDGTTPATAWYTLNHPIARGNIVMMQPGLYAGDHFQSTKWATPSGSNGYAVLMCNSTALNCFVDGAQGSGSERSAIHVGAPYWAVIGVTATASCGQNCVGYCFSTNSHHVLFINVYAHDCIWSGASTTGDYVAYIGTGLYHNAFQNWAGDGGCPSNDSDITPTAFDTAAGPHKFYAAYFSMKSGSYDTCVDGHGLIFDSLDQNNYHSQVVIEQCMMLGNAIHGLHLFKSRPWTGPSQVFNCTFYGNHALQRGGAGGGEVNLQESNGITFNKNIMQATAATQSGWNGTTTTSGKVYALASTYSWPNTIFTNNDYFGVNGQHYCDYSDAGGGCNRNSQYRPTFGAGNVNVDPRFVNPAIPASAPDCSQSATVTACFAPIIAGFKARNPAVAGMGYRPPGACAPDPFWPTWVPVSLIPDGIVTKPCS
jgi:hypothetical protein